MTPATVRMSRQQIAYIRCLVSPLYFPKVVAQLPMSEEAVSHLTLDHDVLLVARDTLAALEERHPESMAGLRRLFEPDPQARDDLEVLEGLLTDTLDGMAARARLRARA